MMDGVATTGTSQALVTYTEHLANSNPLEHNTELLVNTDAIDTIDKKFSENPNLGTTLGLHTSTYTELMMEGIAITVTSQALVTCTWQALILLSITLSHW